MKELLTGGLPTSLRVGNTDYTVASDFRDIVELEAVLSAEGLTDAERGERALRLFYGSIPEDLDGAVDNLCWFMQCGQIPGEKRRGDGAKGDGRIKEIYSFEHDAGLIYAGFMQQYGIDLTDVEYLHWWKFKALFEALGKDTLIKEVMHCRAVDIDPKMPQSQKDYYNAMKRRYEIPLPEGVKKQKSELEEALMNGGSVAEVLKKWNKK